MVLKSSSAAARRFALHLLGLLCAVAFLAAPATAQTLTDRMSDTVESFLSKHGVDIDGQIRAEYFNSDLSGPATIDTNFSDETNQYTYMDLDMQFRPYDFISAKTMLRFYQDWQTFFSTRSRILEARWLSVDGNLGNMLSFNAGDFRQKYTPLTLWAPDVDLLYEPLIFSQARAPMIEDQFLGDNNRVLQGLNLDFAKRFDFPIDEFRFDAIGSRIQRAEYLDSLGYQGRYLAKSDMDRYFLAANSEVFVKSNFFLGGSVLSLMDDRSSFQLNPFLSLPADYIAALDAAGDTLGESLNNQDSVIALNLQVLDVHGGVDIAGMLDNPNLTLDILGEAAQSSQSNRYAWHYQTDSSGQLSNFDPTVPARDGMAVDIELDAGYQTPDSSFGVELTADYLHNEAPFLNPLAQSPTFAPTRILNTENDQGNGTLYSTFDALNDGAYKFTPSQQTENYQLAPFSKTSYTHGIYSPEDLAAFRGDPVLQLLLPFGPATPNRTGVQTKLEGLWHRAWHATAEATVLQELEGDSAGLPILSYQQFGGGLKLELGRLLYWANPTDLSVSYVNSKSTRDKVADELASPDISTNLWMAGIRYQFFPKWALLGGYQEAGIKEPMFFSEPGTDKGTHVYQFNTNEVEYHCRVGLEYVLGGDAYLSLMGGMIWVDRTGDNQGTAEAGASASTVATVQTDFTQLLAQALLSVKF